MKKLLADSVTIKNKEYSIFCVLLISILITGMVIYAPCLWGNKVLVYDDWGYDTYNQYLPAYDFYKNIFLKSFKSNYFFSYGLGSSIFVSICWIADVFVLPAIVICSIFSNIEIASVLVMIQLTKCVVGGGLCYFFLRLRRHKSYGSFVGAYIFSFCGYFFVAGQHYFFSTYLVYFIAILVCVELARKNNKCLFLVTIMSFLVAVKSAYAAFHIFLATAVYVCFCSIKQWNDIKKIVAQILCFGWHIILGLCAGMMVFLPVLFEIIGNSSRVQTDSFLQRIIDSLSWSDRSVIKTAILRMVGNNMQGGVNSWTGVHFHFDAFPYTFSALFLFFFFTYSMRILIKKQNIKERILNICIVVIIIFLIFNNFIPSIFNVFQGPSYRMVFVYIPLFASIVAEEIDEISGHNYSKYYRACCIICLCVVMCSIIHLSQVEVDKQRMLEYVIVFGSIIAGMAFIFGISLKKVILSRSSRIMLLVVLAVNLISDDSMSLYYERDILSNDEIQRNYYNNELENFYETAEENERDNFFRIDRTFEDTVPDSLYSLRVPSRTVSMYNSIIGDGLTNFYNEFIMKFSAKESAMATMQYRDGSFGNVFDNVNADLLGIKYIISDIPRYDDYNWKCVYGSNNKYLYQNTQIDSAGLLYENIITKSTYEGLNDIEKAFALENCIVVEDSDDAKNCEIKNIPYSSIAGAVEQVNDEFQDNDGLSWHGSVRNGTQEINISFDKNAIRNSHGKKIIGIDIDTSTQFIVKVGYMIGGKYQTIDSGNYINRRIIPTGTCTIYFPIPNDADEMRMEFECVSEEDNYVRMNNFSVYTSSVGYKNEGIQLKNPNYGEKVIGIVATQKDAYLFVPIVKEDGWELYIDGEKTRIMEADYCFCMAPLSAGKHEIEFVYRNKYYELGKVVSLAAFMIVAIEFFLIYLKRIKRRKERETSYEKSTIN